MDQATFFLILLSGTFGISSSILRQYYYVNQNKTWQDAQSYCRANYIDLATVESMVDVANMNISAKRANPGYGGAAWIGLRRTWGWSTGQFLASTDGSYAPWSAYQPNEGNAQGACGVYYGSQWSDYYCSTSFYFFCYDDSPTASKRVVLVTSGMNWVAAQTYCKQYYTDLAFIYDITQDAYVANYSSGGWIGLISSQWSDGAFSTFRYWTSWSPETVLDDKCSAMVVAYSGQWISTGCNVKQPFICYGGPQPFTRLYHYVDYPSTWLEAQSFCRERFTDLATIDSLNDVNSLMNGVVLGYNGLLWIGLNRSTQSQWGWSRGDALLTNYSNWDAGRPNGTGQCAANINNVWQDYNCTVPLYFVCYYEGSGYIMVQSKKTWLDAQSYCRTNYNDLATIRSQWEQKQLIALVGRGVYVWIGLFLDTWEWSDQWSLFFRNWAVGQPNSTSGDCAAMNTANSGLWTVKNCNATHPFICYGDQVNGKSKKIIRIKLSHSGTTNLNDPAMQEMILGQIENKLVGQGIAKDAKLSWNVWRDGSVFAKQGDNDQ